ncbi:MAG: hypothetical protein FWB72_03135 [Firmicutes bacterium]|nr:hypothetical protein [Bacillota bacterium]
MENTQALQKFLSDCDEVIQSNFIVAERKITALLKTLTEEEALFEVIKKAFAGFDFDTEFATSLTREASGIKINLSKNLNKVIGLVLTILYKIDRGQIDFNYFLNEHFSSPNLQAAYNSFVGAMILPFRRAIELQLNDIEIDPDEIEAADDSPEADIPQDVIEKAVFIFRDITSSVKSNPRINATERNDLLTISEGLKNAIVAKDTNLINIIWIGFKNTFKGYFALEQKVNELRVLLRFYIDKI